MRNYQISIFRTQGVHTCAYKTKGGTDTKPNAVENTRRFFLNEVATEKLSSEQTAACVLASPVRRRSWCTASPTFRWATRSSRRRCASWSRWWRGWRTATRSWPRRTRSSATRPGCKPDPQPLPHPTSALLTAPRRRVHLSARLSLRSNQQLAQKEKILKEEVEEMKVTLSCTEEGRARASAHSKHVVSWHEQLDRIAAAMCCCCFFGCLFFPSLQATKPNVVQTWTSGIQQGTCMLLCHLTSVCIKKNKDYYFYIKGCKVVVIRYSCNCCSIFIICSVVVTVFNASFQENALIWFSHHADAV